MEIKTTQEITNDFTNALVEYENSKNHITIDNKMLRDKFNVKWVRVDDVIDKLRFLLMFGGDISHNDIQRIYNELSK